MLVYHKSPVLFLGQDCYSYYAPLVSFNRDVLAVLSFCISFCKQFLSTLTFDSPFQRAVVVGVLSVTMDLLIAHVDWWWSYTALQMDLDVDSVQAQGFVLEGSEDSNRKSTYIYIYRSYVDNLDIHPSGRIVKVFLNALNKFLVYIWLSLWSIQKWKRFPPASSYSIMLSS